MSIDKLKAKFKTKNLSQMTIQLVTLATYRAAMSRPTIATSGLKFIALISFQFSKIKVSWTKSSE
jgi:hypothetical protein